MAGRSITVDLNDEADQTLRKIANDLKLSEDQIIRQGLMLVGIYATLEKEGGALIMRKNNQDRRLRIEN